MTKAKTKKRQKTNAKDSNLTMGGVLVFIEYNTAMLMVPEGH